MIVSSFAELIKKKMSAGVYTKRNRLLSLEVVPGPVVCKEPSNC